MRVNAMMSHLSRWTNENNCWFFSRLAQAILTFSSSVSHIIIWIFSSKLKIYFPFILNATIVYTFSLLFSLIGGSASDDETLVFCWRGRNTVLCKSLEDRNEKWCEILFFAIDANLILVHFIFLPQLFTYFNCISFLVLSLFYKKMSERKHTAMILSLQLWHFTGKVFAL